MSILAQHVGTQPERPRARSPPDLRGGYDDLIVSLLSKTPEGRPISGEVVARFLREEAEHRRRWNQVEPGAAGPSVGGSSPDESMSRVAIPEDLQTEGVRLSVPIVPTDSDSGRKFPPTSPVPVPAPVPTLPAPVPSQVLSESSVTSSVRCSGLGGISGSGSRGVLGLVSSLWSVRCSKPCSSSRWFYRPTSVTSKGITWPISFFGRHKRTGVLLRKPLDPRNADRADCCSRSAATS